MTGSLMVIAVNAWMNHPGGFKLVGGTVVDVHPLKALFANSFLWPELTHMYIAGYIVMRLPRRRRLRDRPAARQMGPLRAHRAGDPADDRRAGLARAGARRRLGRARRRHAAADQARRLRGARAHDQGRAPSTCSAGTKTNRSNTASRSPNCCRCWPSTTPNATVAGLDTVPKDRQPPINVVRIAFQTMVGIGTLLALLGVWLLARAHQAKAPARVARGSTAPSRSPGRRRCVALIAGWVTTEVGRQPWVVYHVMLTSAGRHRRRRDRRRLRHARARLPRRGLRRRVGPAPPGARAAARARRSLLAPSTAAT